MHDDPKRVAARWPHRTRHRDRSDADDRGAHCNWATHANWRPWDGHRRNRPYGQLCADSNGAIERSRRDFGCRSNLREVRAWEGERCNSICADTCDIATAIERRWQDASGQTIRHSRGGTKARGGHDLC